MIVYKKFRRICKKKKLLELKSELNEVTGYKAHIQKLIVFLCTGNEQFEIKIF